MLTEINAVLQTHRQQYLDELFQWLRIPSVSSEVNYYNDVLKAANWIAGRLEELGCQVEFFPTNGFPVVFGEYKVDPALPTVMVYGHYDVQPPDPLNLWLSPPFEPVIREDKIYARGACDDKGQVYMHIKALDVLQKTGNVPCNIKFFIEGEEEVGSDNLGPCLRAYRHRLNCDALLISDTSMIANDTPSLTIGLRGLTYFDVSVYGPNRDLHSGVYGGGVGNPINTLCEMIASLRDENDHITIPGFYDDVVELSPEERAEIAKIPFSYEQYCAELNLVETRGEKGYTVTEQTTTRPTLDVNGIWGGYTGEGSKTVLPAEAHAKISMRLVPNQRFSKISALFHEHFAKIAPRSVRVTIKTHHGGDPFITDTRSKAYQSAARAMEHTFGKTPIAWRDGGSIPIMAMFQDILNKPVVLMGFGLHSDAIHSPNEHFGVFNFFKGIETIAVFYHEFVK